MPSKTLLILGLAVVLTLSACEREADRPAAGAGETPAPAAFRHATDADLSGYYLPTGDVRIGQWSLDHVFVGQAAEFRSWEAGKRSGTFAPVMMQFDDATSPMVQTELGEVRSVTARVLPTAYSVSDTRVRFDGVSPELGTVRFDGTLDPGALATARRNLGDEGAVVTGRLKVGDSPARDVQLRWWGGD